MSVSKPDLTSSNKAQEKALALFVSDVHLSDALPQTTDYFLRFLSEQARNTERLYLLGDLFEYWAGDDDCDEAYNQKIIRALRALNDSGVKIFWIAGNRDFLVGKGFANEAQVELLRDPTELHLAKRHLVISHGDALCTDDTNYMAFRAMVRQSEWQTTFLAKPLAERKAIILSMRKASSTEQQNKSMAIMDVNRQAVSTLLQQYPGAILIHGHTHRNAIHHEEPGLRYVLPDWDCDHSEDKRGGWLRLDLQGNLEFIYI
ncbi:UDP-2,3-diacylglucosamine diphosphatase [Undibacterium flavidum]|uniref:UDP-2,3-diacylglucosamine hydrolase n=1 Tax=Undibacterium flavidum TaxID=2762297 RepID=A0ABR6YEH8_9BURK|nr:UDP-2,3-diacylglucosamine diphosphatase [Undibacterium flavidum]MBC3874965.1 UDP-2,3-diacylglucosamine diphosphatase [Undibacterium flavidum]